MNQDLSNNDLTGEINSLDTLNSLDILNSLENTHIPSVNLEDPSIQILSNILFNRPATNRSSIFFDIPSENALLTSSNMTNTTIPNTTIPNTTVPNSTIPNFTIPSSNTQQVNTTAQLNHAETYLRFIEDLLQIPPIQIGQGGNNLHNILQHTLSQKNAYKNILSEEGERAIENITYNSLEYVEQKTCPIMQMDFENGEKISKLPCGHLFYPDAIMRWLKEEKAECPTCRYKMPSFEKKIEHSLPTRAVTSQPIEENHQNAHPTTNPTTNPTANLINIPIRNTINQHFNRAPGQNIHPFGRTLIPRTNRQIHFQNLVNTRQHLDEEAELQAALLASLEEQYMSSESNTEINVENKNGEVIEDENLFNQINQSSDDDMIVD